MSKAPTLTDREALRLIQVFVALPLLLSGFYMLSPFYVIFPESVPFGTISTIAPVYTKIIGGLCALAGIGATYGGIKGNSTWTGVATWVLVSMYVVVLTTRLITVGFIPVLWTLQLGLLLIAAVIALVARGR